MVKNSVLRFSIFGLASGVTFVILDLLIDQGAFLKHFAQTWTSHFGAQKSFEYGSAADHAFDWSLLLKHWDVALPAAIALIVFVNTQRRPANHVQSSKRVTLAVFPLVWLLYSLLVFAFHRPWWAYYYVHIAVPLSWCAAIGLVSLYRLVAAEVTRLKHRPSGSASSGIVARNWDFSVWKFSGLWALGFGLFVLCACAWSAGRVYLQISEIRRAPKIHGDLAIAEMKRFKAFVQFMYADEPIYSFHTGIPMVPNLAVIMLKRLWSGDMTNDKITTELTAAKPGLILLKNDTRVLPYKSLLETEYRLVYYDSAHRLYAHSSIAGKRQP